MHGEIPRPRIQIEKLCRSHLSIAATPQRLLLLLTVGTWIAWNGGGLFQSQMSGSYSVEITISKRHKADLEDAWWMVCLNDNRA